MDDFKSRGNKDTREHDTQDFKVFCYPCHFRHQSTEATRFCKTCNDGSPLCEDCAVKHTREKAIQGHDLHTCVDLGQLENYKLQRSLNQGKTNQPKKHEYLEITEATYEAELRDELPHRFSDSISSKSRRKKRHSPNEKRMVPGKPQATVVNSDSVSLVWENPFEKIDSFQIRYKLESEDSEWKMFENCVKENCATVKGLIADREYRFQLRASGIYNDQEVLYGPISDVIKTRRSLAIEMLEFCEPTFENTSPSKYSLPLKENPESRNTRARTRQLILGNPVKGECRERTIMLVGATGSGKSTLVDGIANYILGVNFKDPFRFKMVTLEDNEKNDNQAHSQTEWITVYKIYPKKGSRLNFTLKIIDTPGFGDTRGIERDHGIVDQIRHLFSEAGEKGVLFVDAVCFIAKAPDARLTIAQKYIFNSIMSLFGKDIESNICTLITFADGGDPPVLASLKESKLPFGKAFHFNNSALYAENKTGNPMSPMFWEMGSKSFEAFFKHINQMETRSLRQTKAVLDEREKLKTIMSNIKPNVLAGLSKIGELRQQLKVFEENKKTIQKNQDFEYTVLEMKRIVVELPDGQCATNCLECLFTCHEDCLIADDDQMWNCKAMDKSSGECEVCPAHCAWKKHRNFGFMFKYVPEIVTKTYAEMKKRHEEAMGQSRTHERYIEDLTNELDVFVEETLEMVNEMKKCQVRLNEIALMQDPLSSEEYIDLLIESEKMEQLPGFDDRIKVLKDTKNRVGLGEAVEDFTKSVQFTKKNTEQLLAKPFEKEQKDEKKGKKAHLFKRMFKTMKSKIF